MARLTANLTVTRLGLVAYDPETQMYYTGEGRDAPAWSKEAGYAHITYPWHGYEADKPARYYFTYEKNRDPAWNRAVVIHVRITKEFLDA